MKPNRRWLILFLYVVFGAAQAGEPPFAGTVWIDPDIITEDDPTVLESLSYRSTELRGVFMQEEGRWRDAQVHIFDAMYQDGITAEMWVNGEHFPNHDDARPFALIFASMLGRLPAVLRSCTQVIEIHDGPGAGGNDVLNRIHMHTDWYSNHHRAFLEEVMVHEAGHACEAEIRGTPHHQEWLDAQAADGGFISEYARDYPRGEDFAETILNWIAVRYRSDRVNSEYRDATLQAVPNRLAYLDEVIDRHAMLPLWRPYSYALPFLPAAHRSFSGFLRIMNRGAEMGRVSIMATDDAGMAAGPVEFELGPNEVRHLTSRDLESGVARSGPLLGRLGDGTGDWWVTVTSEIDVLPLAYIRTADGLLAPVTALIPAEEANRYTVLFVNPCRNRAKASRLRIVNPWPELAHVRVSGIDDAGNQSAETDLQIVAGGALTPSACALEEEIGQGTGKWRLTLEADRPVWVQSLLVTASGHLVNVCEQEPIDW